MGDIITISDGLLCLILGQLWVISGKLSKYDEKFRSMKSSLDEVRKELGLWI